MVTVEELVVKTRTAIKPLHHSHSTLWQYNYAWRELSNYFSEHGLSSFSAKHAEQFITEIRRRYEEGSLKRWKFKLFRKAVALLIEYHEFGCVTWRYLPKWGQPGLKSPQFAQILSCYSKHLEKENYGHGTIDLYKTVCNQFLMYLERNDFRSLSILTLKDVSQFVPYAATLYQSTSMRTLLSALRCFLNYAACKQLTSSDLTFAVPSSCARKTQAIPVITAEEEEKLFGGIDRTTPIGKRNYAMLLLALRLGLRAIDIVQLRLEDIKWRKNSIVVIQQKTGRQLETPLLADVGNAIIDYLLHGRTISRTSHVFLKDVAPYGPLSPDSGLWTTASNCMKNAGIRQGQGERRGSHLLRHTLAARLLAAETPLPLISGILGHANKDSTRLYLSTDLEHLRACALGTSGIEVSKEELK
jgi:site-specific recombinase XerD